MERVSSTNDGLSCDPEVQQVFNVEVSVTSDRAGQLEWMEGEAEMVDQEVLPTVTVVDPMHLQQV